MRYTKIILSGKRNVGKSTAFWALQRKLNWPTFSLSQYLRDYIRIHGLQGVADSELRKHDQLMMKEIDDRIVNLLKAEAPVLVEARVFHFVKDAWPGTLKVLLTAEDFRRVQRNSFREGIDSQKSRKRLSKKESEWAKRMSGLYGFGDFFDPKYYDLVVDTTRMSKEEVVERVMEVVC